MPTAYSYLRFSTPDQIKGDSLRRQTEASRLYAEENGLDLDDGLTFRDDGVSAFRGKNAEQGALSVFLSAVDVGRVAPGSWLLVESLDRLSRLPVMDALSLFTDILRRGITLVTLMDRRVYTSESLNTDFASLLISLSTMYRAHEESLTKSTRLKAAWVGKRAEARASGKVLTGRAPAWLKGSTSTGLEVIPERAKVVARVFDMTLDGLGKVAIARQFNSEGIPTFGRSTLWHPSYIQKILDSETVMGTFQPMRTEVSPEGKKVRVPDGEPIQNYCPPIVARDVFLSARTLRHGRGIGGGRKGETFSNLLRGLGRCGVCESPMVYVNKGCGRGTFLACRSAVHGGGCAYHSWRYPITERFLLLGLRDIDYTALFPQVTNAANEAVVALERQRVVTEDDLSRAKKAVSNITDAIAQAPASRALLDKLTALEATEVSLSESLVGIKSQLVSARAAAQAATKDHLEARKGVVSLLKKEGPDLYRQRSKLHQLLRKIIDRIDFAPDFDRPDMHGRVTVWLKGIEDVVYDVQIGAAQDDASVTKWLLIDSEWMSFPLASITKRARKKNAALA